MPFVLDTSIPACWAFQDEQDARADAAYVRIKTEEAVVPGLWWFDVMGPDLPQPHFHGVLRCV
ncbi:MAG: hypothetical protein P4L56_18975, partial [Candidatus Sulfopaludibacter sp.]|nr:hypothetical protein [Candidatus Sulfopaludibacter sp.]